jgi:hypothetical protein
VSFAYMIDRYDHDLEQLGLSLAEGRELLVAAQSVIISSQASIWIATQDYCHHCYTPLRRKDGRSIVMRTVFGKVAINSPRFWSCDCEQTSDWQTRTISPLSKALPKRVTPELEYLQNKWAAHLPYARAAKTRGNYATVRQSLPLHLRETLPLVLAALM